MKILALCAWVAYDSTNTFKAWMILLCSLDIWSFLHSFAFFTTLYLRVYMYYELTCDQLPAGLIADQLVGYFPVS